MFDSIYNYVLWFKVVYVLLVLTIFSYYDIKYRDIPDKYVWISLYISVVLFCISIFFYFNMYIEYLVIGYVLLSILLGTGLFTTMYLYGLIGKADVFIVSEIALLFPFIDVYELVIYRSKIDLNLPPILPIILYSTLLSLFIALFRTLFVSIKYRDTIPKELSLYKKILLVLIGRPMRVNEFLETKHYYPLTLLEIHNGVLVKKYRFVFNVEEEDYSIYQNEYREMIRSGYLSSSEVIWVTYGIPFLVPLLLGFIVFIIIGDYLLLKLFV